MPVPLLCCPLRVPPDRLLTTTGMRQSQALAYLRCREDSVFSPSAVIPVRAIVFLSRLLDGLGWSAATDLFDSSV